MRCLAGNTKGLNWGLNGFIPAFMDLPYRINLMGHDVWMESGYALDLAFGDVITNDGEILGTWRVVDYTPEADEAGGQYEFVPNGQTEPMFIEGFALLEYRVSRGKALLDLVIAIREWSDAANS